MPMFRRVSTKKRDGVRFFPYPSLFKVTRKPRLLKKNATLTCLYPQSLNCWRWTNYGDTSAKEQFKSYWAFFRGILNVPYSFRASDTFLEKCGISLNLTLMKSGDLNIGLSEKMIEALLNLLIERNRTPFLRLSIPLSFWVRRLWSFCSIPTRSVLAGSPTRALVKSSGTVWIFFQTVWRRIRFFVRTYRTTERCYVDRHLLPSTWETSGN